MSNLAVYMIGLLAVVIGLGLGAHLLGVSLQWIAIGGLVVTGMGVMGAIKKTRLRESSPRQEG